MMLWSQSRLSYAPSSTDHSVPTSPYKTAPLSLCRYSEAWEGRKRDENGAIGHEATRTPGSSKVEGHDATGQSDSSTIPSPDGNSPEAQFPKRSSLPRIYYATRTHSQIGQVHTVHRDRMSFSAGFESMNEPQQPQ